LADDFIHSSQSETYFAPVDHSVLRCWYSQKTTGRPEPFAQLNRLKVGVHFQPMN